MQLAVHFMRNGFKIQVHYGHTFKHWNSNFVTFLEVTSIYRKNKAVWELKVRGN